MHILLHNLATGILQVLKSHHFRHNLAPVCFLPDTHVLVYLIEHFVRLLGNTSEAYVRIFNNSKIKLHDRGPVLNHVITN
jgi:hypothetical protein